MPGKNSNLRPGGLAQGLQGGVCSTRGHWAWVRSSAAGQNTPQGRGGGFSLGCRDQAAFYIRLMGEGANVSGERVQG